MCCFLQLLLHVIWIILFISGLYHYRTVQEILETFYCWYQFYLLCRNMWIVSIILGILYQSCCQSLLFVVSLLGLTLYLQDLIALYHLTLTIHVILLLYCYKSRLILPLSCYNKSQLLILIPHFFLFYQKSLHLWILSFWVSLTELLQFLLYDDDLWVFIWLDLISQFWSLWKGLLTISSICCLTSFSHTTKYDVLLEGHRTLIGFFLLCFWLFSTYCWDF